MRQINKGWKFASIMVLAGATICSASKFSAENPPLTPDQVALLQKASAQEKLLVKTIEQHPPLVQTYIQHMQPDPQLGSVPASDEYLLGRVDFSGVFNENLFAQKGEKKRLFSGSKGFIGRLTSMFRLRFSANGFMDMMFIDAGSFDQGHYNFAYIRKEFLGEIKTSVFDVQPKPHSGMGRFIGRIWVDDDSGNIVRFTGTFSGGNKRNLYFHFDSWRGNVQPDVWLPVAIYVQDMDFRGQTYIWGYGLKLPARESESESVTVENATDASENTQDVSPLQATRAWQNQSEQNVLERLTRAGLLAPPSDFDHVLETVTNNIIIGNKLNLPEPIHCRVMLTSTLESVAVGNTIILSKGLIDVLPYEEDLAAVLSFQLAHIVLGHGIDTRYAFNDRLLFPDESTFQRIAMNHSEIQNEDAAKKAVELFKGSVYADKSGNVGLFLAQLVNMQHQIPSLVLPRLGDSQLRSDGLPWLAALQQGAPALQVNNPQQIAALPLGSHLRIDPWDDKVYQLHAPAPVIVSASDKMPFQVTPIFYKLAKYRPQQDNPAPAQAPAQTPAQASAPGH
jgi:hypothetical protein